MWNPTLKNLEIIKEFNWHLALADPYPIPHVLSAGNEQMKWIEISLRTRASTGTNPKWWLQHHTKKTKPPQFDTERFFMFYV